MAIWSGLKAVLTGMAVSVLITIPAAIMGIPFELYLLQALGGLTFTPLGAILAFSTMPLLANIFVWRAYMSKSRRVTQYSLLITGTVLSLTFAIVAILAVFFSLLSNV